MRPGTRRTQLDAILRAAYSEGLLSQRTFVDRIGQLVATGPVHPELLIGDLNLRQPRPRRLMLSERMERVTRLVRGGDACEQASLLALNWDGGHDTLLVGRSASCDIRLERATVSRQHARLVFRDGAWVVQDLDSKNGTVLNGRLVGRAQLRPGDLIGFADQVFRVD